MTWRDIGKAWHDTTVDYCDVCGNLLIHSYWEFSPREGQLLRACREDDERLYALLEHYRAGGETGAGAGAGAAAGGQGAGAGGEQ